VEKSAVKKGVDPGGKWNATMQLAVTALRQVGGDLSCIGHSKALPSALLTALGRAHSAAYKELHATVSADRGVAVNLLNASARSFAYAPVTKVVMPTGLTATEKRTACGL
jgi:hypothetical protein